MPTKKIAAKKKAAVSPMQPIPETQRTVYLAACRNCCHVPMGVNAVMTILVAVIFTLSAMLIASSVTVSSHASRVEASAASASPVASR